MACSCNKTASFIVTSPDGTKTVKSTEVEAAAMASRVGGTYRPK